MNLTCIDGRGIVHGITACNNEYTLCGNAFDGSPGDEDTHQFEWTPTDRNEPITCERCRAVIIDCRKMKLARKKKGQP